MLCLVERELAGLSARVLGETRPAVPVIRRRVPLRFELSEARWCRRRCPGSGRGRPRSSCSSELCARPRPHLLEAPQHNAESLAFAAEPRALNWQTNRLRPSCREFSTVKEDQ